MKKGSDRYFLVERNNATGQTLVRSYPLRAKDAAFAEYFALERNTRSYNESSETADVEAVLIVAPSEEALREGFPHLFSKGTRAERQERFIEQIDTLLAV